MNFLDGFHGYLVCDGFSGYKTLDRKVDEIMISECWAHARRKFTDAVKASQKAGYPEKSRIASDALQMIASIYHVEGKLQELSPGDRQRKRKIKVHPLVEAFFTWAHKTAADITILMSEKKYRAYSIA